MAGLIAHISATSSRDRRPSDALPPRPASRRGVLGWEGRGPTCFGETQERQLPHVEPAGHGRTVRAMDFLQEEDGTDTSQQASVHSGVYEEPIHRDNNVDN